MIPRLQTSIAELIGKTPDHSVQNVSALLDTISEGLKPKAFSEAEASQIVDALLKLTESLVWGEKHDGSLFDLFCERHLLPQCIGALSALTTPVVIKVQLLQTLSILVQNARRETTTFYLFSGGHLNVLFTGELDVNNVDVLSYFVSLLKCLALRLDERTTLLFLERGPRPSFPLFARVLQFTTHEDLMIRTASRTALLRMLQISQEQVRRCTIDATRSLLAPSISQALHATWAIAEVAVRASDAEVLKAALSAETDLYELLNDLIQLEVTEVTMALDQGVFASTVLPLLSGISPVLTYPDHEATDADSVDDVVEHERASSPSQMSSAYAHVARVAQGQLRNLHPAQRTLVENVLRRLLGRRLTVPLGQSFDSAGPLLLQSSDQDLGIPAANASNNIAQQLTASIEELEEDFKPPSLKITLRALGDFFFAFSTHRRLVEPLASACLFKTLRSTLLQAVYSPGSSTSFSEAVFSPDSADDAGHPSVPIPNPFREALLAILDSSTGRTAPDIPILAWTLRDLQAACPAIRPLLPNPTQFVDALRLKAGISRFAQRALSLALLDLVAPPCPKETRAEVATAAIGALFEAGRVLRLSIETKAGTPSSEDVLSTFLEEWDWHQIASLRQDMLASCRGAELLLECGEFQQADPPMPTELEAVRQAARGLLTLQQFCMRFARTGTSSGPATSQQCLEACPLDLENKLGSRGAADIINCKYPYGCSLMLHPTLLIVNEPPNGVSFFPERTPLWRITATSDAANPTFLSLRIAAPSANCVSREVGLHLEDVRSHKRVLQHFQDSKEKELQRLHSQLVAFIDRVLQECEDGKIVTSVNV